MYAKLNSDDFILNNIMEFTYLPISIFEEIKELMIKLGVPIEVNEEKRVITFLLNTIDAKIFVAAFDKKIRGSIVTDYLYSYEHQCKNISINRMHYAAFKKITLEDLPKFTIFTSQCPQYESIKEHPAFMADYTQIHTEILKQQASGTYAIIEEPQDSNSFLLLIVESQLKTIALPFKSSPKGIIDRKGHIYQSINHFLHDNQYCYHVNDGDRIEKYTLDLTLNSVIQNDPLLIQKISDYTQNLKKPTLIKIVSFLTEMIQSGLLRYEDNQLIKNAISQLKLNFKEKDKILSALVGSLKNRECNDLVGENSDLYYYSFFNQQIAHARVKVSTQNYLDQLANLMNDKKSFRSFASEKYYSFKIYSELDASLTGGNLQESIISGMKGF